MRELRNACKKYGLKFGIYLSPWDRNAECYGQGDAYNRFFIEQLTELLTNYGEVHEVWFDGANGEGPNGKSKFMIGRLLSVQSGVYSPKRLLLSWAMTFVG